jgi:hypothetical protein
MTEIGVDFDRNFIGATRIRVRNHMYLILTQLTVTYDCIPCVLIRSYGHSNSLQMIQLIGVYKSTDFSILRNNEIQIF